MEQCDANPDASGFRDANPFRDAFAHSIGDTIADPFGDSITHTF